MASTLIRRARRAAWWRRRSRGAAGALSLRGSKRVKCLQPPRQLLGLLDEQLQACIPPRGAWAPFGHEGVAPGVARSSCSPSPATRRARCAASARAGSSSRGAPARRLRIRVELEEHVRIEQRDVVLGVATRGAPARVLAADVAGGGDLARAVDAPAPRAPRRCAGRVFTVVSSRAMGFRSLPAASRPAIIASATTVPDPQNGSSTTCLLRRHQPHQACAAVDGMHARRVGVKTVHVGARGLLVARATS